MCGISGFNWNDAAQARRMTDALAHRGPDATDIFTDEGISLGHNRLAVIDLSSSANQPMFDSRNETVVVFNGEIYNFAELKKELESEYAFKTLSDTEVILAGYRVWGRGVVERLNGMFAFAIWDRRDKTLFCARDHAGMKPFYYYWDGVKFIFASGIPPILTHPIARTLDRVAFNHFMRILYAPEPMTMLKNVYKLPPSHTLLLKNGVLSVEAYGRNGTAKTPLSFREAADVLRGKVLDAVKRHTIADVPVGVYLSGGIDSSTVLYAMSQFSKRVQTFSVGFELEEGEESGKFNNDFELAKRTASFFGAEHHPVVVSARSAFDVFDTVTAHNSDPISHPTSLAMYLLAKHARSTVTVALTGNAGDELFGGYDRYRMALAAEYYRMLPAAVRGITDLHPRLAKLEYGRTADLFARFMFEKDAKLSRIMTPEAFMPDAPLKRFYEERYFEGVPGDTVEQLMSADRRSWLPDYFYMLSDKMSMASALEERMPFADKELTAFALSLPRSYKVDVLRTKKILRHAFRKDLPGYLFTQPKRGWFSPAAKWLRRPEFTALARELISPEYYAGSRDLFDWHSLASMLERHLNKEEYNLTILWAVMTYQAWARRFSVEA